MLDLKAIREEPERFRAGLARRGASEEPDRLIALDEEERRRKVLVEELRAEQNRASKEIGRAAPEERRRLIDAAKRLSEELERIEPELQTTDDEIQSLLARLPNLPHESVPDGADDEDNRVEREVGKPPAFGFAPRDHVELGEL